ncbi:acetyl-CoA hydrolase/transferase C-terminal domain-containing protein [Salmonirosea aquatica]|uniref:Acetyl-CoA hydrolase/transferase C-terminal domain-containing protein n=1 Tax=Salmonirosea aquatica TaxID=2654236 RepID=A0A7C9F1Y8_9BACT|nr:hypothetical protein [Cytophagaceae bacterium SJW1-29]
MPTTSVGNIPKFAQLADKIIIEINTAVPLSLAGSHDIFLTGNYPNHAIIPITAPGKPVGKNNAISRIVPMVSHVDHTEHDVDIIVTEQDLADHRGLAPRQRAKVIIENCVHPEYQYPMQKYFTDACKSGGHTPQVPKEALSWHERFRQYGTMPRRQVLARI